MRHSKSFPWNPIPQSWLKPHPESCAEEDQGLELCVPEWLAALRTRNTHRYSPGDPLGVRGLPFIPKDIRGLIEACETDEDCRVLADWLESKGRDDAAQWIRGEIKVWEHAEKLAQEQG